ncbi:MAG: hypothetical protein AB1742_09580, partial [bacterium]
MATRKKKPRAGTIARGVLGGARMLGSAARSAKLGGKAARKVGTLTYRELDETLKAVPHLKEVLQRSFSKTGRLTGEDIAELEERIKSYRKEIKRLDGMLTSLKEERA